MKFQHFNTLSQDIQYKKLLLNGVCLADRDADDTYALLFQLDNFYVEVFFTKDGDEIVHSRSFESTDELQPYLNSIDISRLLKRS